MVMVTLSLLLSAGLLLLPVNAEDNAEPDTSGYDWDIGQTFVEVLDRGPMALMDPPRWQWNAERYKDEGDKCAEKCESEKKDYIRRYGSELDRARSTSEPVYGVEQLQKAVAFCKCAQKYYNKAFELTKPDDYEQQAEIFEAGADLYATLGDTKAQKQVEKAAIAARAQAAAQRFSLPLPEWIAVCGIIGGLLLIQRKRK